MGKLIQGFSKKGEYSLRDLAIYTVFYLLIVKTVGYLPSRGIEHVTAWVSSRILQYFGLMSNFGFIDTSVFLSLNGIRNIQVTIIRECSGIHIWGILVALILPLKKADLIRKFTGIFITTFLVFFINISRIIFTVYLTAFNVPPFYWFLSNPKISNYHYPISFITGLLGIVIIISILDKLVLPELGDFLVNLPLIFLDYIKIIKIKIGTRAYIRGIYLVTKSTCSSLSGPIAKHVIEPGGNSV